MKQSLISHDCLITTLRESNKYLPMLSTRLVFHKIPDILSIIILNPLRSKDHRVT